MTVYESNLYLYRIKERTFSDGAVVYIPEMQSPDNPNKDEWCSLPPKATFGEAYIYIQSWIVDDNAKVARKQYTDKIL